MVDIDTYLLSLTQSLKDSFGPRLCYVGLQGSYLRGEATEQSDIDIAVILDNLASDDLKRYRALIEQLPEPEKSCGFICGRAEMAHWNPMEICHLLHTTRGYYGSLADFVPAYTRENVRDFIKFSLNNLYHALAHTRIHAPEQVLRQMLPAFYKQVFFILQNLTYLNTNKFYGTKSELLSHLTGQNRTVLLWAIEHRADENWDTQETFEQLFDWCQHTLNHLNED